MPVTPFGRPVDAALMARHNRMQALTRDHASARVVNKWEILRHLSQARLEFDLSDRALSVLQALLSFHPETELDPTAPLVVYPSNQAICERLNGMANSTMRRHLSRLIQAGFLIRRDSPNGKRYVRKIHEEKLAYGFDLSPLPLRMAEITAASNRIKRAAAELKHQRDIVSILRRDLAGLAAFGAAQHPSVGLWDQLSDQAALAARQLRRSLSFEELQTLETELRAGLQSAHQAFEIEHTDHKIPDPSGASTTDMSTKPRQNEQHHQNSDKDLYESNAVTEDDSQCVAQATHAIDRSYQDPSDKPDIANHTTVPLSVVLTKCQEVQTLAGSPIPNWHVFVQTIDRLCPMMGINASVWQNAMRVMGAQNAAVTVAAMLERFDLIRNPSGYLRHLTTKARTGVFSPTPMVLACADKP